MSSRFNLKSSLTALLLASALWASACGGGSRAESKTEEQTTASPTPEVVDVTTSTAVVRQLPRFTEATGSLAADEQTDVSPQVGGRVAEIYVDLGTYVQRGQTIARLDAEDAQLRLRQLEAQAAQSQAAVRQAEERIGLRAGATFNATNVAEVGAARAALELAEKQLRRFEKLIESGDVSRSAYDQQRAQRDQLREQYQAAVAQANQSYAGVQTAREAARAAQA
ncbi:MAG TPA: biotin/lipoyl-binding protein, partial [Pyrinomonadaceae bacterium]|nr:biotin/lipoyl-binding protein [Pyrinomonadaceae bacterium]